MMTTEEIDAGVRQVDLDLAKTQHEFNQAATFGDFEQRQRLRTEMRELRERREDLVAARLGTASLEAEVRAAAARQRIAEARAFARVNLAKHVTLVKEIEDSIISLRGMMDALVQLREHGRAGTFGPMLPRQMNDVSAYWSSLTIELDPLRELFRMEHTFPNNVAQMVALRADRLATHINRALDQAEREIGS
jgi:hypothetical protein